MKEGSSVRDGRDQIRPSEHRVHDEMEALFAEPLNKYYHSTLPLTMPVLLAMLMLLALLSFPMAPIILATSFQLLSRSFSFSSTRHCRLLSMLVLVLLLVLMLLLS